MTIHSLIVAMDQQGLIGRDNDLPWRLSADLQYFKKITMGKPIIMGRKTHESIGRVLPGRQNIVITGNKNFIAEGCTIVTSIPNALAAVSEAEEAMFMGGASLYEQVLPQVDRLYLTQVHAKLDGDTWFPEWDHQAWIEVSREDHRANEKNEFDYSFIVLERREENKMSELYGKTHRVLQDEFETRPLADRMIETIVSTEISEDAQAFIESRPMFFLSTVDKDGQPTTSYKGGAPGFVTVVDNTTIAFPSYDGNGMFYSMGNIRETAKVGILFIDFETPQRVRFHGSATVSSDDPLMAEYKEAELIVRVKLSKMWINCPRYIHKYKLTELSKYVPCKTKETPFAGWKRVDLMQGALAPKDADRPAEEGGIITIEEWLGDVQKGDG